MPLDFILILILLGLMLIVVSGVIWFVLDQKFDDKLKAQKKLWQQEAEDPLQKRLEEHSEQIKQKKYELADLQSELNQQKQHMLEEANDLDQAKKNWQQEKSFQLFELSQLDAESARERVLKQASSALQLELKQLLSDYKTRLNQGKTELAQEILTRAVQRLAVSHASEQMSVAVPLADASWRGKVIGKSGRMIQTLQTLTGADFSVDDDIPQVWVSSFDPRRRELARRVLVDLINRNQLRPERIDGCLRDQDRQIDAEILSLGEFAATQLQILNLHPEILKTLGLLHYRRSFGQDVLQHSIEVALLAGLLAQELHGDVALAQRGGLLHDIGKALAQPEQPESHTQLGVELARRCGESELVLHIMAAHHFEEQPNTLEAVLVQVADTLSAARPGARSDQLRQHVQRLSACEAIASRFAGVTKAWVLKAGHEVRVMIDPDEVSEADMQILAAQIGQAIRAEVENSGPVKVSLIREWQANEYI